MAYQNKPYKDRKAEVDEAFQTIANEVPKVFQSERFREYLNFSAKFHNYSVNNQLLIAMQKPGASLVTGYRSWQNLGRQVNRGEKGIRILAPSSYKTKREVEKKDEEGRPVIGKDGKPEKELQDVTVQTFTTVAVFDVSQTSGEPLPEIAKDLTGNSKDAYNLLEAVKMVCDVPVYMRSKDEDPAIAGGAHGYYSKTDNIIVVDADASLDQQAKTLVHEWGHSRIHSKEDDKPRDQKEIEAESTAYVISRFFGLDTSSYSFDYISSWSAGRETKDLHNILRDIRVNANDMISKVQEVYEAVVEKNRDLDMADVLENKAIETDINPEEEQRIETANAPEEPKNPKPGTAARQGEMPSQASDLSKVDGEQPGKAAKNEGKAGIEDFGEKIGGARKDLWKERGLSLNDLEAMNEAERAALIKKDNIWAKPDYQDLVDQGIPKEIVFFMKNMRDKIPTAPVTNKYLLQDTDFASEQERFISFVSDIRDHVMACRNNEDVSRMSNFFVSEGYLTKPSPYSPYYPTKKSGRYIGTGLLKASRLGANYSNLRRECEKAKFLMSKDEKILSGYEFMPYLPSCMHISEEKDYLAFRTNDHEYRMRPDESVNLQDLKENTYFAVKNRHIIAINFESEERAKYAVLAAVRTSKERHDNGKRKTSLKPQMLEHIERHGPDYRNAHASGQDYLDTFHFRGGEFGNWLNDKERQASLDFAYDAFKDLGKALGISDRDIALDGRLSIAFGARGKGAALAHYESVREVINLTKMKGAGSLGHEWIHAMDDIVGKKLGIPGMMSKSDPYCKEVPESFKALMKTIKYTTLNGQDAVNAAKEHIENECESFRRGLEEISQPGATPELEEKRQSLIRDVIDEARHSYGYKSMTLNVMGNPRHDNSPSPAYGRFIAFQKEQGDNNPGHNTNRHWANSRRSSIGDLCDIVDNRPTEIRPITVKTKFYEDALKIDANHSKSGHGYWSSECEMLARAGASYIADKCSDMGIRDDYLSGHSEMKPLKAGDGTIVNTSPQGEERKLINKAFDRFFEDMIEKGIFQIEVGRNKVQEALPCIDEAIDKAETGKSMAASRTAEHDAMRQGNHTDPVI